MSDHKCIFCGKDATNKTKEHVIPQWLIRMTGDHRRIANFGTDFNQIINSDGNKAVKPRMFSFNSLTFPACRDCNEKYGKILENNAFTILNKIMNEELISETEIMHFMDWLDKIRIGLWLGFDILNQNPFDVKHKFYLEKRIGYHDRILLVYRASKNDLPNGINFIGPDTPAFAFLPCCLTIRINNFFFFNVSKENILLEKLGFPFLERFVLNNELNPIKIKINEGHKKISTPILNFFTIDTSVKIFQPIYKAYINDIDCNEEYIKNNSFNCKEGLGNIFSENNHIVCHKKNIKLSPSSEFSGNELITLLSIQTFKTLRTLWDENIAAKFENESTKQKVMSYYQLATETISAYLKKINSFNQ